MTIGIRAYFDEPFSGCRLYPHHKQNYSIPETPNKCYDGLVPMAKVAGLVHESRGLNKQPAFYFDFFVDDDYNFERF